MSPYQKNQKEKKRKNLFRKWHRWIGFSSAIFLLNLAITGILLNHSTDFNLHKKHISITWIVNWFGIKAPENFKCLKQIEVKDLLCQVGSKLVKENISLVEIEQSILGISEIDELLYIATTKAIYIFTSDFELVESLEQSSGLPNIISKIGFVFNDNGKQLAIKTKLATWEFEQNMNLWKISTQKFHAAEPLINSPKTNNAEFQSIYLKHQLSYLKLIQDIHSGQIFNLPGKIMTDLSGLIIILLSISGFIAWQRRTKQCDK